MEVQIRLIIVCASVVEFFRLSRYCMNWCIICRYLYAPIERELQLIDVVSYGTAIALDISG